MKRFWIAVVALGLIAHGRAWAHDGAPSKAVAPKQAFSTVEKPFGREGDPKKVSRVIKVDMADSMRYSPGQITVRQGETVRIEAKNSGKAVHEIVLGTLKELKEHAELMRRHPGMEHDEPYMVHVAPGKTGYIVWQFTQSGTFHYGCLIPGHFESGMAGKIHVTSR